MMRRAFPVLFGGSAPDPAAALLAKFPGGDEVVANISVLGNVHRYHLAQHIGSRKYVRYQLHTANITVGQDILWLKSARICDYYRGYNHNTTPAVTRSNWGVDNTSTSYPDGRYMYTTTTGGYLEFTTHAGCTSVGALCPAGFLGGGMLLVTIDSDNTLADSLPTAQQLVDGGTLAASALVAGGGTLNPTDRVLDTYNLTANYDGPGAACAKAFTSTLTAGAHTVRLTQTAYKNVSAGGLFTGLCLLYAGGPNAAGATGAANVPVFIFNTDILTATDYVAWEISYNLKPTGATDYEWLGHVGSAKTKSAPTLTVDGASKTIANHAYFAGNELAIVEDGSIRHTEVGAGATELGVLALTFTLNKSTGLTISHTTSMDSAGVAVGYPCMLAVGHATMDRYQTLGSGVAAADLAADDDSQNFRTTQGAAYAWDSDGYAAMLMYIPDLAVTVESWAKSTDHLFWFDASEGVWNKAYTRRFQSDEAYTDATVWTSAANYRAAWFTDGAGSNLS